MASPLSRSARWQPAVLAFVAAAFIRLLRSTLRLRHHGDEALRRREAADQRVIIAFWHRHLLLMPYCYRGRRISVLISQHKDGELIARTMRWFGIEASRGSSTRGGAAGFRDLLRRLRDGYDLGITPDGPRGPACEVKPGVIQLAALAAVPIQPVALAASRARRLKSWDGFVVPLPGCRVHLVYGEPLEVAREADAEALAAELKRRLDGAALAAVAYARGEAPSIPPQGAL